MRVLYTHTVQAREGRSSVAGERRGRVPTGLRGGRDFCESRLIRPCAWAPATLARHVEPADAVSRGDLLDELGASGSALLATLLASELELAVTLGVDCVRATGEGVGGRDVSDRAV